MLEWLFGKKQAPKEEKKEEIKKEDQLSQDEQWVYDYVRQYLTSPLWRNPILDFMEENCLIFEDSEENKFQYTKIFQQFTGLTALLLESMIEEIGVSEKTFEKCLIRGIGSKRDAKIFKQILLCDNFLAFKALMVSKNKELQVQALRKIQSETKETNKSEERQLQIDVKELERLEIEKAIALSMAMEAKTQEQKELQEAIKLSQIEYEKQEEKRIQEKKQAPKEEIRRSLLGPLPPISSVRPHRPINEEKEEGTKLKVEINEMKKEQQIRREKEKDDLQNEETRKKRLMEQRQLIKKKKQEQRKEDLANYSKPAEASQLSPEELERRRNLMKRLKEQLKE